MTTNADTAPAADAAGTVLSLHDVRIRSDLRTGDLARIVQAHGVLYAREYAFDWRFEAYVAGSLVDLAVAADAGPDAPPCRVWLAERADLGDDTAASPLLGMVAIIGRDADTAQLRWFLVDPAARGIGLGRRLLDDALAWSREQGFQRVFLWTVGNLDTAARMYRQAGFTRAETLPARDLWGRHLAEERHDLVFNAPAP